MWYLLPTLKAHYLIKNILFKNLSNHEWLLFLNSMIWTRLQINSAAVVLGSKKSASNSLQNFLFIFSFVTARSDGIALFWIFSRHFYRNFSPVVKASFTVASSRETKCFATVEEGKAPNLRKYRLCSNFLGLRTTCPSRRYYKNMWDYNFIKIRAFTRCNLCYFIVSIYTHILSCIFLILMSHNITSKK